MAHLPYSVSATFTNGSDVVTAAVAAFIANVKPGDWVRAPDEKQYFIKASVGNPQQVDSNTQVTLDRPYLGTDTTATVLFSKHSDAWSLVTDANARLARIDESIARGYTMQSNASLVIGTGTKVFTGVESGLNILDGIWLRASSRANPANYMEGVCTYSGSTLTMTVSAGGTGGSGTFADWNINIAGVKGSTGGPGSTGPAAWSAVAAWTASTVYTVGPPASVVTYLGETYVCTTSHTSTGSFDASKFAKVAQKGADGAGAGDVVGPASSTADHFAQFNGTTGKLLKGGLALSTDGTLAGNSDTLVPSQKAVKTYADGLIAAADAMVFKGVIDCSANPNYPAADRGATYRVSVAGKIGGASGVNVEAGDILLCLTDSTAGGNHATVGANWSVIQTNLDGAVIGPASSSDNAVPRFDATTGKLIQGSGVVIDDSNNVSGVNSIDVGNPDTTVTRAAAGVLAVEGVVMKNTGKETVGMLAISMIPRTTNGAAFGTAEMTTNKNMVKTLDFDTTTQEFVQFEVPFPKSWNLGTVTFQPVWSHAATTTNFGVVWALQAVARSDGDALDVAFGTEQTSTDTGGTTNTEYIGPESAAITVGGSPAVGDMVLFQLKRNVADGADTMAIDARLHGIRLFFTSNAATDA